MDSPTLSVTEFTALFNQITEYSFSGVTVTGEVSEFKINQGKWVFFKLKDEESAIECFTTVYNLHIPLEDGMRVALKGIPKLTKWGRLSFSITNLLPVGEGSIKKSFDLLKAKLEREGLFAPERKRPLPTHLENIGIISSSDAAGYADFIKILGERSGGLHLYLADTQVQGLSAPEQMIRALDYFNEKSSVDLIVLIRGGGSKDDLSAFNDESLVRAVASSKIPVITGIGHEVDTSLCDLSADIVASTPSNVAQMIVRDKREIISENREALTSVKSTIFAEIDAKSSEFSYALDLCKKSLENHILSEENHLKSLKTLLDSLNPETVLRRGYAILSENPNHLTIGNVVKITTQNKLIETEVKNVTNR